MFNEPMVLPLDLKVRISSPASGSVIFQVEDSKGNTLLRSTDFSSICRLEQALGKLFSISRAPPGSRSWHLEAGALVLEGSRTRLRLTLAQQPDPVSIESVIRHFPSADVIDVRDPSRRRIDLSGPLRLLVH